MKYNVMGKNVEISDQMKEVIIGKLEHIEKYFIAKEDVECRVLITNYNIEQKVEVTIPTKFAILRAEVINESMYNGVDEAVEKIERQIRKAKTKMSRKNKESFGRVIALEEQEKDEEEQKDEIVKTKFIRAETMDINKAIGSLEMLGHDFFIYKDEESKNYAVVYKRKKSGYGLIEIEK